MATSFKLNGKIISVKAESDTPLLWVIRDEVGLTGTKFGCGKALCGACTVHLEGAAVRSCSVPLSAVAGKNLTTIESMSTMELGKRVQAAWLQHDVAQWGYCQSGQIMSAVALLKVKSKPSDADAVFAATGKRVRELPLKIA